MQNKSILLIISGGIAAYKSLDLIRRLKERGARVRVALTEGAKEFITPLAAASLSEEQVFSELFNLKDETEIGHIRLSREADLIVIAPATANLLAKMAVGLCDDLASTVILAADKPVLAAPAMNWRMWQHPATVRNVEQLKRDGVVFVGPNEGAMACGEWGVGRMAEVDEIVAAVNDMLSLGANLPLKGIKVVVTAGPTFEPIDPVRFVGNRSSGKQGYAIAQAAAELGAKVTLISGPGGLQAARGVDVMRVETARQMLKATEEALPADVAIFNAAVSDWRADKVCAEKIKKDGEAPKLKLVENPDILKTIAKHLTLRPRLVIGFAAETEKVVEHAKKKLEKKGCDWIVANDVSSANGVFGGDENKIVLIRGKRTETWPLMTKADVARRLMETVVEHFQKPTRKLAIAAPKAS